MTDTINGKTPEEIKRGLECCKPVWVDNHWKTCDTKCPYIDDVGGFCRAQLMADALALIQQLERERDAAVETVMLLANEDCTIPCESDELACSEYCEKHCNFRSAQKECWLEYFRRCGVQEVE